MLRSIVKSLRNALIQNIDELRIHLLSLKVRKRTVRLNSNAPINSIANNSRFLYFMFTLLFFLKLSNLKAQVEKLEVEFNPTGEFVNIEVSYPVNIGSTELFVITKNTGTWQTNQYELWRTDGTKEGTSLVKNLGQSSIYPSVLTGYDGHTTFPSVNGNIFFSFYDAEHGNELWKSDGTEAGTKMVKDINPGPYGSNINNMMVVGNTLFFSAFHPTYGSELWKTDGSEAGTVLVRDINPGVNNSRPEWLIAVGDLLFFSAIDPVYGQELWKSDGTEAGTVLVKDVNPGSGWGGVRWSVAAGNMLYFDAFLPETGYELWKSNGTEAGTIMVKDVYPGTVSGSVSLSQKSVIGDKVYFYGGHPSYGGELWVSDGTDEGTLLVKDIYPGTSSGIAASARLASGNYLYLQASDPDHGTELWRTDGTLGGTLMLKDIMPGVDNSNANWFTAAPGNVLYFTANSPEYGNELWESDGTPAGTELVADLEPGIESSFPRGFFLFNDYLYFFTGGKAKPLSMHRLSLAHPVPPAPITITPSTVEPTSMDTNIEMSAPLTDLNLESATWDWGDGTTSNAIIDFENKVITGNHGYTTPGVYTVTLISNSNKVSLATKRTFNSSEVNAIGEVLAIYQYIVVYDVDGGYVTGGGWIDSPEGAYKPDLNVYGKANFGFVSKFKKGTIKPSGDTDFEFKAASLNFKSTKYDWLVISGATARFKGEGTINGNGNYGFILAATDGQINGGGGYDKFRIKIWDIEDNGRIVYDNNLSDEEDDALANMTIAGGSIAIHTSKKSGKSGKTLVADKVIGNTFYSYPTAFSNSTTIAFALDKSEAFKLEVFDLKGTLVKELAEGVSEANRLYKIEFDSKGLTDGVYITRLTTTSITKSIKTVLKR